jgi:YVTN family beta-propeller protein
MTKKKDNIASRKPTNPTRIWMKRVVLAVLSIMFFSYIIKSIVRKASYSVQTSGKLYIVNKLANSVSVFDLSKGKEAALIPIEISPYEVTSDSYFSNVIVSNYGTDNQMGHSISIINPTSNTIEKIIDLPGSKQPHGIVQLPNTDKIVLVTNKDNHLLVINLKTGVIEKKIPTLQAMSHLLVLHPSLPIAYVTNVKSASVSVIDLVTDEVVKIISLGNEPRGVDITRDGKELWVTNSKEHYISIIDTETFKTIKTLETGKEPLRLKFTVDGKYALVTNATAGSITVYDSSLKKLIKTIQLRGKKGLLQRTLYHTPRPIGLSMHPNGKYAFVANSNAYKIEVIDLQTLSVVSTIGTEKGPYSLVVIP